MFFEIQPFASPKRVRSSRMEKSSSAGAALSHYVRVGGGRFGGGPNFAGIDFVLLANREDLLSQCVITDEPGTKKLERSAGTGEVHKHVERSAAGPLGLRQNRAQLLWFRIDIDYLDLVNN